MRVKSKAFPYFVNIFSFDFGTGLAFDHFPDHSKNVLFTRILHVHSVQPAENSSYFVEQHECCALNDCNYQIHSKKRKQSWVA